MLTRCILVLNTTHEKNNIGDRVMQEKLQFPKEGVYMYIVKGRDEYLYIGLSGDLSARLEAIERGEGPESLKRKTPVELVYVRRYPSFADAREISKRLKV